MHRLPDRPWHFQARSSGPKWLTSIDRRSPTVHTREVEDVLKACPLLESLDAIWSFGGACHKNIAWAALGAAVTRYGSNIRQLTLHSCYHQHLRSDGDSTFPANLASLSHLRELTLPVQALLPATADDFRPPPTDDDEYEYYEEPEPEEDEDAVETPTVSLCRQLTYSLQHLIITDDWHLRADTIRPDEELQNLMLDPQFSELLSIRVRRWIPWSNHVKDLGWHMERHGRYWNALLRPS